MSWTTWRVHDSDVRLVDFEVGDRVELHPSTNAWMFGDRMGTVTKVGTKLVHVHMDRSGRTLKLFPYRFYSITRET
jgi:hypothetical protein